MNQNASQRSDLESNHRGGASYFFQGFELIRTKGIKRFVLVPLIINLLLFSTAFYFLLDYIQFSINYVVDLIPDWLGWLKDGLLYLLWPIAIISVLLVFALIFGTLANWIAAPFNGLLSEKVERYLSNQSLGDEGLLDVVKDIPRTLGREMSKLGYFIPRAIGFLLLFFLLPVVGQVLWFLFTAWMMAIQYVDYPFDNRKSAFVSTRDALRQDKSKAFSFGIMVNVFSFIPVLNFVVMPVAICGATAMYIDHFKQPKL
ncbi:sulfate transporter CysZ [Glaciecola petra]|uniref:Sulfate transporter CysZ n=1 Tax=Glaciecola petra TaxID=3075602 RepID=A0ABU2ZPE0_9ALTE|nr:sulfate transporter CysZ [Aestuariibacter sp. P117]MDT0594495.1 sulfate transporter CysZ [Aestuariibacter sp. P117]